MEPIEELEYRRITRTSQLSGITRTMVLAARPADWAAFDSGMVIQRAFPFMPAADREFLLTGITGAEWDAEFNNDRMTWGDE